MKQSKLFITTAALMLMSGAAQAAHLYDDPHAWSTGLFVYTPASPKYTANEFSLDLFGSFIADEHRIEDIFKTNIRHGEWGGGVGINYFFTREIGIGGDINMSANGGKLIDQALGSLIIRWPFESCGLAPYIFGGGGRSFEPEWEWLGHAGVGLEWRLNPNLGIFTDGRYEWLDHTSDRLLLRAGLRIVF